MKTVRFAKVVEASGRPEIYLLLERADKQFEKFLKANRVMSLLGGGQGSKTTYGTVGYDAKQPGQLLIFPRSLKSFEDSRIVGIDYDVFEDHEAAQPEPEKIAAAPRPVKERPIAGADKTSVPQLKEKPQSTASAKTLAPGPAKKAPTDPPSRKVISFPKPEKKSEEEKEDVSADQLRAYARQAMRALERNNAVAAYNLLKRILGED